MSTEGVSRSECEAIANPKQREGWHQDNASALEKRLARAHIELLDSRDELAKAADALASVLRREVDRAAKATSPSSRMLEYEPARAALAQWKALKGDA